MRALEVKRGWNDAVTNGQCGFDKACHAGGCVEMADVRFHRAHTTELHSVGMLAKCRRQCFELDRIAECRRGAVCFDVAD